MTKLQFENDVTPLKRVENAIRGIPGAFAGVKTVDGVQLQIIEEDDEANSYGDVTKTTIIDTPIGLFKVVYNDCSYGYQMVGEKIGSIQPVKAVNKPVYEHDPTPR